MSDQTETSTGICPTHGTVQAERRMPRPGWPYLVYAIRRMLAAKRPYRCPDCGMPVTGDESHGTGLDPSRERAR
jgi:hypothetical protein